VLLSNPLTIFVVHSCPYLSFRWPCIVINSYNKNQPDALVSQIYFFGIKLYMFRTVPMFVIGNILTVHTAACEQDQDVPSWSCSQAVSKLVRHIPLLCVEWKTPDDGQRNCQKHVVLFQKTNLRILCISLGFIVRTRVILLYVPVLEPREHNIDCKLTRSRRRTATSR